MHNWTTNSLLLYEFCTSFETEIVLSVVKMNKQQQFHIATYIQNMQINKKSWSNFGLIEETVDLCHIILMFQPIKNIL